MQINVCKLVVLLCAYGNKAAKPKQCLSAIGTTKMLQHAGRIMKLTAVLLLGACMQIYAAGYGQKITLSERDVPIEQVLKKIQAQTNYKFLYTSQLLSGIPKVTVVVKDATVERVLDIVLKGQMLDYEVTEGTVVIKPRSNQPAKEQAVAVIQDPPGEIRGVITDENGAPASGVNVMVKGSSKGTTTNLRGEFVLRDVNENAVLLITSVGYDRQELLVKGKEVINTQLKVAVGNLDEMQVIAYGKTSKRFQTGNVASVKAEDIEKQPVSNPLLALEGRVPGLFITQANGLPGGGVAVRIQGENSIGNVSDPLYVIDGVPYASQLLPTTIGSVLGSSGPRGNYGNPLNFINPSDIESIEILKDADATAIYGSRAANGAILITTKKGKAGPVNINFNVQNGWGKVTKQMEVLNTSQYLTMRKEAINNDGLIPSATPAPPPLSYAQDVMLWDTTRYTDWQDELIGNTSEYRDVTANISGGTINSQYFVGATYHLETTVFPGSFRDRKGSLHFSLNSSSTNKKFRFQLSGNYLVDDNQLPSTDLTNTAVTLPPTAPPLYNSDGTLNWMPNASGSSTWSNPLRFLYETYHNKTNNLIGNSVISYQLLTGLDVKVSLGYTNLRSDEIMLFPLIAKRPENRPYETRYASYSNNSMSSWIIEPQISYKRNIGKGKVELMFGATKLRNMNKGQSLSGTGYNSDNVMEDIRSAANVNVNSTVATTYKYVAVFSRINYNLLDRYIINLNARRDGSSRFGPENQFHNFGSIGAAWIFSQENFAKSFSILSFGKLKGSYGNTGNDQIGDYRFMNLYTTYTDNVGVPYQNSTALTVNELPNPYLQWEETKKLQIGIELGFLNDRILIGANYIDNISSNQLLAYNLPSTTGFNYITANFPAKVANTALEFQINTTNVKNKNLIWTSSINFTIPKNKLLYFPDLENSPYATSLKIGEPITIIQAYHFYGVNPSTGVYEFLDLHGNTTSTPDYSTDRTELINTLPKFYGGVGNNFKYKNFEIDVFFQFVKQLGTNYKFGFVLPAGFKNYNQPLSVLDRWQKAGDIASIQRFTTGFSYNTQLSSAQSSNAAYSDASYVRLKTLSLSYKLPSNLQSKLHLQTCRFYVQAQNLLTITNYESMDPENQSVYSLPPLRVLTIGIQIGL